jgi:PST family polysaccharide transporter
VDSSAARGSLTQRTLAGVSWAFAARFAGQIVQFAITATLARLLLPSEFGLVAMCGVFTGFAVVFVDLGLAGALLQRKEIEERHLSSAFWANLAAAVVVAAAIAGAAPAIAAFYDQPRLVSLTIVAALPVVIGAPAVVHFALLRRALNFRRLGLIDLAGALFGGAVAIAAAAAGAGVWSLVVMGSASTAARSFLFWRSTSWRPRLLFDRSAMRELWGFGGSLAGSMSVNYWSANIDNLLVGRFAGVSALGFYSRAYNTMMIPLWQILGSTTTVMFPALASIQDERARVKSAHLRAVRLISLVAFPTLVGLAVVSDDFIVAVFGSRWSGSIPMLRVLCIGGIFQVLLATGSWIFQSQGRTDWMLRWAVVRFVALIAAFAVGVHWGALGVCVGYTVSTFALAVPGLVTAGRLIGCSLVDVAGAVWRAAAGALLMGAAVLCIRLLVAGPSHAWPALLLSVAVGVVSYLLALRAFGVNSVREIRLTAASRPILAD